MIILHVFWKLCCNQSVFIEAELHCGKEQAEHQRLCMHSVSYANHSAGFYISIIRHTHTRWNSLDSRAMFPGSKKPPPTPPTVNKTCLITNIVDKVKRELVYLKSRWLLWSNIYAWSDSVQATLETRGRWRNANDLLMRCHVIDFWRTSREIVSCHLLIMVKYCTTRHG